MRTTHFSSFVGIVTLASAAVWSGCSSDPATRNSVDGSGTGGGISGTGGVLIGNTGGTGIITGDPWPKEPIFDDGVGVEAQDKFTAAPAGTGPCVSEPQDGAMIPRNWLRPRFRFTPAAGEDLFQITLTSASMENPLVIYTKNPAYTMPANFWGGIGQNANGTPVTVDVTIRATPSAGGAVSESKSAFLIAPVDAGGSMVYWASKESKDNVNSSKLVGFKVGEEGTIDALTPAQVQESDIRVQDYAVKSNAGTDWSDATGASPGKVSCIGCHTSTPDGDAVSFNNGYPWSGITASIEKDKVGQRPSYVTELGARLLQMPFIGTTTYSKGHWGEGMRIGIATTTPWTNGPYDNAERNVVDNADLIWVDLAAEGSATLGTDATTANAAFLALKDSAWGVIPRGGDLKGAVGPAWSNDGKTIAYTSAQRIAGSHVGGIIPSPTAKMPDTTRTDATEADIYTVPFADKAGGAATPLKGASQPGIAEYYADYSVDDKFIAFNRAATTVGNIYYRADGEINVIPASGADAPTRLKANDPPACSGETSPGVINSWAKWSPSVGSGGDGKMYYWLIFSSGRAYPEQFWVPRDYYTPTNLDPKNPNPSLYGARSSQLYLAAVVTDASGNILETYPAVYIWNQGKDTSNLTPAWDEFKIPDAPIK